MATYYLPSETGWQANGGGTYSTYLRVKLTTAYNSGTNATAVTAELQVKNSTYTLTWNSINDNYRTFTANGHTWTLDSGYRAGTHSDNTWVTLAKSGASAFSYSLQHDSEGKATISVYVNLYLYAIWYVGNVRHEAHSIFGGLSATKQLSEPRGSVIASCSSSVATQGTIALAMTRYNSAYYHRATFKIGNTQLAVSDPFATSLSYPVPRSWFDAYPNDASKTVTVSVQTYTDSSCSTTMGSPTTTTVTVHADAGMRPTIGAGFAAAAPYNAGAVSGLAGYIQGRSKARLTLTKSALTMANNAAVASYTVACQGASTSVDSPGDAETVDTAALTGTAAISITVTVTDSRGRTASTSLTVTPLPCAAPTLSGVEVFRCDGEGRAAEDGAYLSAKATAACSPLDGQNSVTLTAKWKSVGGSFGPAQTLASGAASVLGGALDPDTSYEALLTATDALGATAEAAVTIPALRWAMKFRPDGQGVGFGLAPAHAKALELPADWQIYFGPAAAFATYAVTNGDIVSSIIRATRHRDMVFVEGYLVTKAQTYTGQGTVLFTMPVGTRPGASRLFVLSTSSSNFIGRVEQTGAVWFNVNYSFGSNTYLFFNFAYRL